MRLGFIGLGKMGHGMAARLIEKGHQLAVYDADQALREKAESLGAEASESLEDLVRTLEAPRSIWLMVPHSAVDEVLNGLLPYLEAGDTVIDGGNSRYLDTKRRAEECAAHDISFIDAGISGGPRGAREGACVMVGGAQEAVRLHEPLFLDIAHEDSYRYVGPAGAGHYAKMVHNGIEYGMMQAIAEGFSLLKESEYDFDLGDLACLYDHRSVIESRLIGWLSAAYAIHGEGLEGISGTVGHSGEGEWTVEEARRLGIPPLEVIEASLEFRKRSAEEPSYRGQILSALRNQFGGHDVTVRDDG